MHTYQKGQGQKILVMLHGWGGSHESFLPLSQAIEDKTKDFRFIIPDFPGFGDTPPPSKVGWSTHDYQHWLDEIFKQLKLDPQKDEFYFYGHSFGCRVIIRWLMAHPEYKNRVILTGAAGVKWPPNLKQKIVSTIARITKPIRALLPKPIPHDPETAQGLLHKIVRKFYRLLGAGDWHSSGEMAPTLQKVLAEEDLRDYFPSIQNQTLLLWGAQDTYTPMRSAQVFESQLPNNTLIVFPEGRHGIHYSHKEEIAKLVIEFLCNNSTPSSV